MWKWSLQPHQIPQVTIALMHTLLATSRETLIQDWTSKQLSNSDPEKLGDNNTIFAAQFWGNLLGSNRWLM